MWQIGLCYSPKCDVYAIFPFKLDLPSSKQHFQKGFNFSTQYPCNQVSHYTGFTSASRGCTFIYTEHCAIDACNASSIYYKNKTTNLLMYLQNKIYSRFHVIK